MSPYTRPLVKRVVTEGPTRVLEAEVEYILTTWHEVHPYGSGVAYEQKSEFYVQAVQYLTDAMTVEEKKLLDDLINEGPYE